MTIRPNLAGAVLALACASSAQATVLTDDAAAWSALVPNAVTTAGDPAALYGSTNHVTLATGPTLASTDTLTVLQPGTGWLPWSSGYAGDIFATPVGTASETFSLNATLHTLAFYVAPDINGPINGTASVTVTLSDGTTLTPVTSFTGASPAFFGFTGGDVTGFTISTSAPDFAIGAFRSVSAPGGLGLLAVGLGTLALLRRR